MQKKRILLSKTVIAKLGRTGQQLTRNVKSTLRECVIYYICCCTAKQGPLMRVDYDVIVESAYPPTPISSPCEVTPSNRMAVLMHKQASRWLDALDVTKLITMEIYCCTLSITPSLPIHPLTATETEPSRALTSRKLTVRLILCLIFYNTRSKISTAFSQS